MATSPTQLTLKRLRDSGYQAEVVERWNPHARIRQDLFGFIDIIAVCGTETLAVQCTSDAHVAERVRKIAESTTVAAVREAGWSIEVWGWKQAKPRAPWTCRVVDVS